MENKIQIITYPDSLGKNLKELDFILEKYFKNIAEGLHILPFYPSSDDRGFAPLTHLEVDPRFGNWDDIRNLSKKYILVADLMVNHISASSFYFQDYLKKGTESKYADYFITSEKFSRRILPERKKTPVILDFIENIVNKIRNIDKVFHSMGVSKSSLKKIYRPRPESPFIKFEFGNGKTSHLWCTFSKEQIDLDVHNGGVKRLLRKYISNLSRNGVNIIRLDAVGYLIKKRGTRSFMLPETRDFIAWLGKTCHKNKMLSLPEIHSHYSHQVRLSGMRSVDYVYDFQIPMLILQAIYDKNFKNLEKWIKMRPTKTINVLDTHDGIPIVDVEDLLTGKEIAETSTSIMINGGNEIKRASGDNGAINVDTYQINCTYYSALNEDDDAYILARAIQFFIPGVPQVYYVGLLAGKNDVDKLRETNIGRDVNRHDYTIEEIENEIKRPVVKRLLKLMEFRNNHPIFNGSFSLENTERDDLLILKWRKNKSILEASLDLSNKKISVNYIDKKTGKEKRLEF